MARKPHKCEAFQGKFLIGQKTITADSYVRDHQKFQKIYGSIADKILALKKEGDFLEIGAGGATLASIIAQKANNVSIVATDISADMVKLGRKAIKQKGLEKRIDYIHCKGEDINFPNKKFDAIYSSFSLNYWKDPVKIIGNLQNYLNPGGIIFIMDFRRVWWVHLIPSRLWRDVPVILAGYTRKEIYKLIDKQLNISYEVKEIYPLSLSIVIKNNTERYEDS